MPNLQLRPAITSDAAFIVELARHACVIEDWPLPESDSEDVQSLLPGSADLAIVATDTTGVRLGGAWTFRHDPPLLVDINGLVVPEVAMAVMSEMRGEGVGSALLDELVARSIGRYEALCLNVHRRNPAAHLYERKGFRVQGKGRGGLGVAMLKDLR
jgi:GNAT superfamily N-acetyltransferase